MNFHPQRTVRRVTIVLLITGILAVLSLASGQFHQTRASSATMYSVTDLGTLGGTFSGAGAINNRGEVTGISAFAGDVALRGFIWKNGVMTDLGTLGGDFSYALGMNEAGIVVGYATLPSGEARAVYWNASGITALASGSLAVGINSDGVIVGEAPDSAGFPFAARWRTRDNVELLGAQRVRLAEVGYAALERVAAVAVEDDSQMPRDVPQAHLP